MPNASNTAILPLQRTTHFFDRNGDLSYSKRPDEKVTVVINWANELGSDTISSAAYVDSGTTRTTVSATTTTTTCTVTGVGYFKVTATLASGNKLQKIVNFYDSSGPGRGLSDYGE